MEDSASREEYEDSGNDVDGEGGETGDAEVEGDVEEEGYEL